VVTVAVFLRSHLAALVAMLAVPWLSAQTTPRAPISAAISARAIQPGELAVLTITTEDNAERVHVRAFERDLTPWRVDAHTWRVLVGIDLDVAPGRAVVNTTATVGGRPVTLATPLTVLRKSFPTRQLKVDEAFVNPPPDALARIERDTRELNKRWASSAASRLWTGPFVRPVPQPNNSAFGTRSVFNGQPRSPHSGADFQSPAGTPIHAPNAGRIVLAEDLYYSGNTVIVDHGLGLFSLMAHLSEINVKEGDSVAAGDVLGKVGATGRVTGPHLHWAIRINGARVDPLSVLALLGTS